MRWILAAAIMAAPAQAMAAPVYLTCDMVNDGKPFSINIALDEASDTATMSNAGTGEPWVASAIFTADKVTMADKPFTWTIDRVTLRIAREIFITENRSSGEGKCTVAKPPANRAF